MAARAVAAAECCAHWAVGKPWSVKVGGRPAGPAVAKLAAAWMRLPNAQRISDFLRGGVEALKATVYAGPPPVKTEAALRVITPLLEAPVANRPNWTIPRLIAEIKTRERVRISRSQLSKAMRKKSSGGGGPGTR